MKSQHENLVISNELKKVELPPGMIWKDDVSSVSPLSESIRPDEHSLTLETSAFQSFIVAIRCLPTRVIKPKYHVSLVPPTQHHSFVRKQDINFMKSQDFVKNKQGKEHCSVFRTRARMHFDQNVILGTF